MIGLLSMVVRRGLSQLTVNVGGNQSTQRCCVSATAMLPSSVSRRPVSSRRSKQTGPRRIVPRTSPNGVPSGNLSKHKWSTTIPLQPTTGPHTVAPLILQYVVSNHNSYLIPTCDAWPTSSNAVKDSQNSSVTTNEQLPNV